MEFHISYFKCGLVSWYLPINVQWFGSKSGGTVVHAADEEVHLFGETENIYEKHSSESIRYAHRLDKTNCNKSFFFYNIFLTATLL